MNNLTGVIPEFNFEFEDWSTYEERLDQFFEVNGVPYERRNALMISVIGSDTYRILRDLCHPDMPKNKPYHELCEIMRRQFNRPVSVFRERFYFYNTYQYRNENVAEWFARVKQLAVECKFGNHWESIVLDKFVSGLKSGSVFNRICDENEHLKLNDAFEIAKNKEVAVGESDNEYEDRDFEFRGRMRQRHPFGRHNHYDRYFMDRRGFYGQDMDRRGYYDNEMDHQRGFFGPHMYDHRQFYGPHMEHYYRGPQHMMDNRMAQHYGGPRRSMYMRRHRDDMDAYYYGRRERSMSRPRHSSCNNNMMMCNDMSPYRPRLAHYHHGNGYNHVHSYGHAPHFHHRRRFFDDDEYHSDFEDEHCGPYSANKRFHGRRGRKWNRHARKHSHPDCIENCNDDDIVEIVDAASIAEEM